ncbi:DUF6912 family protein [Nocardioides piscis]|uniref:Uncharacterized protein n=1 Tax=Nocardioides piscis TaxID=2714938 RepID=A0A6G7YBD5_9ACTN|nr:hypothetical protein [Nocardioides piscis]QIK74132.1 hypothetical protein G7071_00445 [Nocardioides piscis]
MRVYLPLTLATLRGADEAGEVPEHCERFTAEDESEEAEYAALMTAADASAEQLDGAGRRVVLVADVVEPAGAIPKKRWAAVHVDTDADADPDDDLAWYGIQEIPELIAGD